MSHTRIRWIQALLIPIVVLFTMELLLQVGSLIIQAGAREMPRNWLTDNTRLLAIGDSNTFGLYVEPDESYPAQLQKSWNHSYPKYSIEVLNLGYPGMNSFRILDNIDAMMEKFWPDAVLLTVGVNDILTPVEEIAYEGDSAFAHLVRTVGKHSRLYHLIHMFRRSHQKPMDIEIGSRELEWHDDRNRRMEQAIKFRIAHTGETGNEIMSADGEEFVVMKHGRAAKHDRFLNRNISLIQQIVQRHGADFYLLTYASSASMYASTNRTIRRFANQTPVRFIDVAQEMKRTCPDSNECPDIFFEDLHPKATGYGIVANVVLRRLAEDWSLTN